MFKKQSIAFHVVLLFVVMGPVLGGCIQPVATPGAVGIGEPGYPTFGNGGYDTQHYTIDLAWNPDDNFIDATTTIEAVATQNLSRFNLDFIGLEVTQVNVNGQAAQFDRDETELIITPVRFLPINRTFTVTVAYHGVPERVRADTFGGDVGWRRSELGVITEAGVWAKATWLPGNAHPKDRATYTTALTVPKPYTAIFPGIFVGSEDEAESTTFYWNAIKPIAHPVVIIGEFVAHQTVVNEDFRFVTYFPPDQAARLSKYYDRFEEMYLLLSQQWGPSPYEELTIVSADDLIQLTGGFTTEYLIAIDKERLSSVIVMHELAHQWFGLNVASASIKDNWLSEGPASYAENIWLFRKAFAQGYPSIDERIAKLTESTYHSVRTISPPTTVDPNNYWVSHVYDRGAFVMMALLTKVGADEFERLMRSYLDHFALQSVSTQEFIDFVNASSEEDMTEFLEALLYSEPIPSLAELGLDFE